MLLVQPIGAEYLEHMPRAFTSMTSTTLRPQLKTALMRQLSQTSSRNKNLLQKGFTLVELMVVIVIVIVGILSAIALPNFLNQTAKAKATEAKSQMSAMFKNGSASYTEGSITAAADVCKTAPGPQTLFTYACTGTLPVVLITATGNGTVDTALANKKIVGCVNLDTGLTKIDKELNATTPTAAADCETTP